MVFRRFLYPSILFFYSSVAFAGPDVVSSHDCNLHQLVRGKKDTVKQVGDNFDCLLKKLENLSVSENSALSNDTTPPGLVAFFLETQCPKGWTEFEAAGGRYIVAMPKGGSTGELVGTALSDGENRIVGKHSHGGTSVQGSHTHEMEFAGEHSHQYSSTDNGPLHDNPNNFISGRAGSIGRFGFVDTKSTTAEPNHSHDLNTVGDHAHATAEFGELSGTSAPYIQLLACVKEFEGDDN